MKIITVELTIEDRNKINLFLGSIFLIISGILIGIMIDRIVLTHEFYFTLALVSFVSTILGLIFLRSEQK